MHVNAWGRNTVRLLRAAGWGFQGAAVTPAVQTWLLVGCALAASLRVVFQIQGPTLSPITCLATSVGPPPPPALISAQSTTGPHRAAAPVGGWHAGSAPHLLVAAGTAGGELRVWRVEAVAGGTAGREVEGGGGAEARAVASAVGMREGAHSQAVTGIALAPLSHVLYSTSKVRRARSPAHSVWDVGCLRALGVPMCSRAVCPRHTRWVRPTVQRRLEDRGCL